MSYIDARQSNQRRTPSPQYTPGTNVLEDPAKLMGEFGLLLMFAGAIFPPLILVGYIVCLVANKKSKRYGFVNGPARMGVGFGGFVLLVIAIIVFCILAFVVI